MDPTRQSRNARLLGWLCTGLGIAIPLAAIAVGVYTADTTLITVAIPLSMMLIVVGIVCLNWGKKREQAGKGD